MQIRIQGTSENISLVVDKIRTAFPVKSVSQYYSNRNIADARVYIVIDEAELIKATYEWDI